MALADILSRLGGMFAGGAPPPGQFGAFGQLGGRVGETLGQSGMPPGPGAPDGGGLPPQLMQMLQNPQMMQAMMAGLGGGGPMAQMLGGQQQPQQGGMAGMMPSPPGMGMGIGMGRQTPRPGGGLGQGGYLAAGGGVAPRRIIGMGT